MGILSKLTKPSLKMQFNLLTIGGALLPIFAIIFMMAILYNHFNRNLTNEINRINADRMKQIVNEVIALSQTAKDYLDEELNNSIRFANVIIEREGGFFQKEAVKWVAVNKESGKAIAIELPKMFIGKTWLGQNTDPSTETPFVDFLSTLLNCNCTVYQRMNEQGDMLIVATNQINRLGNRLTGEFLPFQYFNGVQNGMIAAILQGKDFQGREYQENGWHSSSYEPIFDEKGNIIGMFELSLRQVAPPSLKKALSAIDLGPNGNVFILGSNENELGVYIASKLTELNQQNLWDLQNLNGEYPIRNIINTGLALQNNDIAFMTYKAPRGEEVEMNDMFLAIGYWKNWDWIVGVEMSVNDFYTPQMKITNEMANFILWSIGCGILFAAMVSITAFFTINKLVKPIEIIKKIAQHIAQGDLIKAKTMADEISIDNEASFEQDFKDHFLYGKESSFDAKSEAETFLLTAKKLALNLYTLVSGVQHSGSQVSTSSTQIAVSSRELSTTASQQAASATEVVASSKQISNTAQELVRTMTHLIAVAAEAASFAQDGKTNLNKMEQTIRQFVNASNSITSKLAIIRDRAKDINNVVYTINNVADQTNLISLNAAIEAERAGEYGLGFAVVAREIRRLADQTATATQNIEHIIDGMNSAVLTGIIEAEKFGKEVEYGVVHLHEVNSKLEKVIAHVEMLPSRFEIVNERVQDQSLNAMQIAESMAQLEQATREIYDALREFNNATEQLNETAMVLEQEVDRFKISDKDLTLQNL
jgi:methyl-accepting chemotaxis protein WspA